MANVFVTVELDADDWNDPDDPMPITVSYHPGISVFSVIELLQTALDGLNDKLTE